MNSKDGDVFNMDNSKVQQELPMEKEDREGAEFTFGIQGRGWGKKFA